MLSVERCLAFGLLLSVTSVAFAQTKARAAWVTEIIKSHALGNRTILVATPEEYRTGNSRYPVVVMLDANDALAFQLWIAQAAYVADNSPGLPPVIAVGIVNGSDRIHDMSPPATGSSVKDFKTAGGAATFADFIIGEVLPHVRAKYRTVPMTILAGHSAGGLFALDVAAHRPEAFQGIIAMSPALWFNDSSLVETYSDLIGRSRTPRRIFVSSGGLEKDIDITSKRFARRMDATRSESVAFSYRGYPDDTHPMTSLSFSDGLRFIFEPLSPGHFAIETLDMTTVDSIAVEDALRSSQRSYTEVARSLRLPEEMPEKLINRLGYRLLGSKKAALAILVFRKNVQSYPQSVNVYDSLADGLLAAGDTVSAIAQLKMAVKVARKTGAVLPVETKEKLKALTPKR